MKGLLLAAYSDNEGYSKVIPPWPMVLSTWTIAWQDIQPKPFWASGVSIISRMRCLCIFPARISAWSWQPPHHREDFTPMVSCMYSTDLRYHWLLNDAKWCIELNHWL